MYTKDGTTLRKGFACFAPPCQQPSRSFSYMCCVLWTRHCLQRPARLKINFNLQPSLPRLIQHSPKPLYCGCIANYVHDIYSMMPVAVFPLNYWGLVLMPSFLKRYLYKSQMKHAASVCLCILLSSAQSYRRGRRKQTCENGLVPVGRDPLCLVDIVQKMAGKRPTY